MICNVCWQGHAEEKMVCLACKQDLAWTIELFGNEVPDDFPIVWAARRARCFELIRSVKKASKRARGGV